MSFALHHFRKEARYLLPRWFPWITLLLVELALNLEWFFPLEGTEPLWLPWFPLLPLTLAFWLTATHAPEDAPSNHNRFLGTRPLSTTSYWIARLLVFVLLIVIPLTLKEALYSLLSQRPWDAVLHATGQSILFALGTYLWIIPASALFRGVQLPLAVLTCSGALYLTLLGADLVLISMYSPEIRPSSEFTSKPVVPYFYPLAVGLTWFAIRSSLHTWNLTRRLVACTVLTLGLLSIQIFTPKPLPVGSAQAKANAAASQLQLQVLPYQIVATPTDHLNQPAIRLELGSEVYKRPSATAYFPKIRSFTASQNGRQSAAFVHPAFRHFHLSQANADVTDGLSFIPALLDHFPANTIFNQAKPDPERDIPENQLPWTHITDQQIKRDQPLTLSASLDLHWVECTRAFDIPLRSGSSASTTDLRWKVLSIKSHQDVDGSPKLGAVTVTYRAEWPSTDNHGRAGNLSLLLHSPDRGMVWQASAEGSNIKHRGQLTHWSRRVETTCFENVLNYADGQPALKDIAGLRVVGINGEYIGATAWNWQSEPLKLQDHSTHDWPRKNWYIPRDSTVYRAHPDTLSVFKERLAHLSVPTPASTELEVARYLYEIISAHELLKLETYYDSNQAFKKALLPVAQHHLHQLLQLPDEVALELTSELLETTAPFINETFKQPIIDGISERTWLSTIVSERGWEGDALPGLRKAMGGLRPLNWPTLSILRKSNSGEAQDRLIEEARRFPRDYDAYRTVKQLTKHPHLRPRLSALSDRLWSTTQKSAESIRTCYISLIATTQGNVDALDYALRIAGLDYNSRGARETYIHKQLAALIGLPESTEDPPIEHLQFFRNSKAEDFIYLPEESRWKKKQP